MPSTLLVDSRWLVDSFSYKKYLGKSEFGGSQLADPVTVTGCRISYKPSYTRVGGELTRLGDAIIYCYAAYTEGAAISDLIEKSEVIINGKTYTIKQAKRYSEIASGKPYSVELVVI